MTRRLYEETLVRVELTLDAIAANANCVRRLAAQGGSQSASADRAMRTCGLLARRLRADQRSLDQLLAQMFDDADQNETAEMAMRHAAMCEHLHLLEPAIREAERYGTMARMNTV